MFFTTDRVLLTFSNTKVLYFRYFCWKPMRTSAPFSVSQNCFIKRTIRQKSWNLLHSWWCLLTVWTNSETMHFWLHIGSTNCNQKLQTKYIVWKWSQLTNVLRSEIHRFRRIYLGICIYLCSCIMLQILIMFTLCVQKRRVSCASICPSVK